MSQDRLLVVDDQPEIASLIAAAGEACGYEARTAGDGALFRLEFEAFNPTLIALDLSMPGEDGIELMRYLAEKGCTAGVLIVSGSDDRVLEAAASLARVRGLRMLGTIPKPFRLKPLKELFAQLRHGDPVPEAPARSVTATSDATAPRRRA